MTPLNPPIVVPAIGGTFEFTIAVINNIGNAQDFDIWTEIHLPLYGTVPILTVTDLTIPGNTSIERDRTQNVPEFAPPGVYTYYSYIGEYPWVVENQAHFNFEKLGEEDGWLGENKDWPCIGELFDGESLNGGQPLVSLLPDVYAFHAPYPNPFNPRTELRFDLPEAVSVSLVIYDIQCRETARLVDGWYAPGYHHAVFDASQLASGVYFAHLKAGDFQQTQKLLLIK